MPPELGDRYLNASYTRQGSRVFVDFKMGGKGDSASRGKGISIENEFSEETAKNARLGSSLTFFTSMRSWWIENYMKNKG